MNSELLRDFVIIPTLEDFEGQKPPDNIVNLLLGTAAQESHMGEYVYQIKGPAIGIYQIEPRTHQDVINNYLNFRPHIKRKIWKWRVGEDDQEALIGSLFYQTLIARTIYRRVPERLPEAHDTVGLASYWKEHYNTKLGKGKPVDFISNYTRYVSK